MKKTKSDCYHSSFYHKILTLKGYYLDKELSGRNSFVYCHKTDNKKMATARFIGKKKILVEYLEE